MNEPQVVGFVFKQAGAAKDRVKPPFVPTRERLVTPPGLPAGVASVVEVGSGPWPFELNAEGHKLYCRPLLSPVMV